MADVAHWRLRGDTTPPKAVGKLTSYLSKYDVSRVKRQHDLHCDRVLRERTDNIRTFQDLPKPQPESQRAARERKQAYHRVKRTNV